MREKEKKKRKKKSFQTLNIHFRTQKKFITWRSLSHILKVMIQQMSIKMGARGRIGRLSILKCHICFNLAQSIFFPDYLSCFQQVGDELGWGITSSGSSALKIDEGEERWGLYMASNLQQLPVYQQTLARRTVVLHWMQIPFEKKKKKLTYTICGILCRVCK